MDNLSVGRHRESDFSRQIDHSHPVENNPNPIDNQYSFREGAPCDYPKRKASIHRGANTKSYNDVVVKELGAAKNKADALAILADLKSRLLDGTLKINNADETKPCSGPLSMTTQHVFLVGSSLEEDRPEIDFQLSENSECVDWLLTAEILDGIHGVDQYEPPQLIVHNPDAADWDFYRIAGTFGIISKKAFAVLGPLGKDCFDFLPAFINGQSYYLFRLLGSIDVLDKEQTVGKVFPHDPTRFMRISKYAFNKSKLVDPCIFAVPDMGYRIFGTDSIGDIIHRNNLRGFRLVDSESESE